MDGKLFIQAKNLLDNLVDEYKNLIKDIHKIDILLKQIKSIESKSIAEQDGSAKLRI